MNNNPSPKARAIGGVFFRCEDPEATRGWYERNLGLAVDAYGTNFAWRHHHAPDQIGHTQWSPFKADTDYFGDASQQFMVNYRVDDLETLVANLRQNGVTIVDEIQIEPYGKFIHIVDNDGRRVELWEPIDTEYNKMVEGESC